MSVTNKTLLVYDPVARYTHVAQAAARDFGKVLYATSKNEGYCSADEFLPGRGLDDIEWCADPFAELSRADCVAFPAVGDCGLQEFLRKQGWPVWGSGNAGRLELDRWFARNLQKDSGIATPKAKHVRGLDNLREVLEDESDVYIKLSLVRSAAETFHHTGMLASKPWLDNLAERLGPYGALAEFTVEDPIDDGDCVEVGFDTFFNGDSYPSTIGWGYEVKDACFVSTVSPLPKRLQDLADKLAPILQSYDYRGPISNEVRCTGEAAYQIDPTMRCGNPPSQLQCYQIKNYGEVIWQCANGEEITPEYKDHYGVQIVLKSEWFQKHPLALDGVDPLRTTVFGHCVVGGQTYAVNTQARYGEHLTEFGAACGTGSSLASALESALDAAKEVKGLYVSYSEGDLTKATDTIKTGTRLGLTWR